MEESPVMLARQNLEAEQERALRALIMERTKDALEDNNLHNNIQNHIAGAVLAAREIMRGGY